MDKFEAPTNLTRDNVEQFLRVHAPVPNSDDRDAAERVARKVVNCIAPLYQRERRGAPNKRSFDEYAVFRAMRSYWLPRCPALQGDEGEGLFEIAEKARRSFEMFADAAELERRARLKSAANRAHKRRERERAEAEYEDELRRRHADDVKKLSEGLSCGVRHAQALLKDGTTVPATAQRMAEILDTKAADHLHKRGKTGPQADLSRMFMARVVEGAKFRDFLVDSAADSKLVKMLRKLSKTDVEMPDHFVRFEQFLEYARPHGVDLEEALMLWHEFIPWMMDAIHARAVIQYKERHGLADYDFG